MELGRGEERTEDLESWALGVSLAELGRGEELSLAVVGSGAWQRRGVELGRGEERRLAEARSGVSADWSLEILDDPTGSFIFLLFLWFAVLAASGSFDTMVRGR